MAADSGLAIPHVHRLRTALHVQCNAPLKYRLTTPQTLEQARTLGPWSSAMELVNAREKAQHDRQAKLQEAKDSAHAGTCAARPAVAHVRVTTACNGWVKYRSINY